MFGMDPGGQTVPEDTLPNKGVLKLHSGLRKAESSVLVHAHTGRIGLTGFLYNHKVPGIESAKSRCGAGEETPLHTVWPSTAQTKLSAASTSGQTGESIIGS
jgi:hypothetical protein